MVKDIEIKVSPAELHVEENHRTALASKLGVNETRIRATRLLRSSLDARHKNPKFVLLYRVWVDEGAKDTSTWEPSYRDVSKSEPVIVVGSGPAGLFSALRLIELGLQPIVIERGREVQHRRRDIARLSKYGEVNPDSNYCFGEGGAGTFSDGKLYTRSKKRGSVQNVLQRLVYHGATNQILIESHPHIGTNKLPKVVSALKDTIRSFGGQVLFNEKLVEIDKSTHGVTGIRTASGLQLKARAIILATGHSARDIFTLLANMNLEMEAKPFALGVRVEHPQTHIDKLMYGQNPRHENLPAASYTLRAQANQRGVFSFCMCPGGVICPAATSEGEVVVNGWSPSKRNAYHANSGIVVEVSANDLGTEKCPDLFAALNFQQRHEQRAYELGGGHLKAPAQRLTDLLENRLSASLPRCSYTPGITSVMLSDVFDPGIFSRLREGLKQFNQKFPGYITDEAVAVAVESRTSSPIKIPRLPTSLMHPELDGLFPCGEGAGYAGGIMSAAIDGEHSAEAVSTYLETTSPAL